VGSQKPGGKIEGAVENPLQGLPKVWQEGKEDSISGTVLFTENREETVSHESGRETKVKRDEDKENREWCSQDGEDNWL